jgi:hypothetical protein
VFTLVPPRAENHPLLPSRNEILDDPEVKAVMGRLNKACPDCETYLTVGVQYGSDDAKDEIPTVFLFVKDYGYKLRIFQIETTKKLRLITVLLPGKTLDLNFRKFAKKLVR